MCACKRVRAATSPQPRGASSASHLSLAPWPQVKVILMPMTLADVAGRLYGAAVALGSLDPAGDALRHGVNCGMMRVGGGGVPGVWAVAGVELGARA